MKIHQMPKQEDVVRIDSDVQQILVVPVTDENRNYLVEAAFSAYLGEQCKYCEKIYETLDDLKDTVWAGEHENGRLACKTCWTKSHEFNRQIPEQAVA